MDSTLSRNRWLFPTWQRFLVVILLTLGIFFRFINLDKKIYGHDETFTSLRVSGYTEAEAIQKLWDSDVISTKDLQKYQSINSEKGVSDTIRGLAVEEPQHPPLYYAMVRLWAQWFGSSVAVLRSLSAYISLLTFPCIYWLCLELFESPLAGWIAVALVAISPFHVLYAQEAREYSLWTVTILLSSAAFLRAMRLKTWLSWGIYSVTLAAGFYTFLLSILVTLGQGIYVAALERFRLSKMLIAYLVASIAGILAFLPWLLVVITNRAQIERTTNWAAGQSTTTISPTKASVSDLLRGLIRHPGRVFFDLNVSVHDPFIYRSFQALATVLCLVLVGYSLYFLCRKSQKHIWLFIFTLIGATTGVSILQDLFVGSIQSGGVANMPRYQIPCYLAFQLAVTYLLTTKLTSTPVKIWQQKLWQSVGIVLVSAGVLSCTISSQADVWWTKGEPERLQDTISAAHIINQAVRPLLISDTSTGGLMLASHLLEPKVKLMVKPECFSCHLKYKSELNPNLLEVLSDFTDVFVFPFPSDNLLHRLEKKQNYKLKPVSLSRFQQNFLWKVEKH